MLRLENTDFSYVHENKKNIILKNTNFEFPQGSFTAITGPSGIGKSTLFYLLGLLLKTHSGNIFLEDVPTHHLSAHDLALLRNQKIGFIFQQFHLLPKMKALDNILLPGQYPTEAPPHFSHIKAQGLALADKLKLTNILDRYPKQLSGGQQQRIAIARALLLNSPIILADEPTGSLDPENKKIILDILHELHQEGKTIIMITHEQDVAASCPQIATLSHHQLAWIKPPKKNLTPTPLSQHTFEKKLDAIEHTSFLKKNFYSLKSLLPLSLESLRQNRMRTILTMLGIIMGAASTLSMITIGNYAEKQVLKTFEFLGSNTLWIHAFPEGIENQNNHPNTLTFEGLSLEQDIYKQKVINPYVKRVSPFRHWGMKSIASRMKTDDSSGSSGHIMGIHPDFLEIFNKKILLGKAINLFQYENKLPVCILGYTLYQNLFPHKKELADERITVTFYSPNETTYPCTIIGVFEHDTSQGSNTNELIIAPLTSVVQTVHFDSGKQIYSMALQMNTFESVEKAQKFTENFFKTKYGNTMRLRVYSDEFTRQEVLRFLKIFRSLLMSIALLSLIVGGLGINNMMLLSINDRLQEYGLRKTVGATDHSIMLQVLLESLMICLLSGILGLLIAFGLYQTLIYLASVVVPKVKFEWILDPMAIGVSLTSVIIVGITSGIFPARKAQKIQIIEALKAD